MQAKKSSSSPARKWATGFGPLSARAFSRIRQDVYKRQEQSGIIQPGAVESEKVQLAALQGRQAAAVDGGVAVQQKIAQFGHSGENRETAVSYTHLNPCGWEVVSCINPSASLALAIK